MFLERLTLRNFQSFGPETCTILFDKQLTALLGLNAAGKTAACQALLRLFGVINEQRQIRVEDFHVPNEEDVTNPVDTRELTIEAVFSFPELADPAQSSSGVPEFFAQMSADENGDLKLRIVLEAKWTSDGTAQGAIEDSRRVVHTFAEPYGEEWRPLRPHDRNRIQFVYVPATRNGGRQVSEFLRGRLWRACQWSPGFQTHVADAAGQLAEKFKDEAVVKTVTGAIDTRWRELHHLATDQSPLFEPISREMSALVTNAEMHFEPSPTGRIRPARELSDGQQSLLHIALTSATLDLEAGIANGTHVKVFDIVDGALPSLTLLAIEEPENNLAPYFLSRVVNQLLEVTSSGRAQALISSHSPAAMSRVAPEKIRHFRLDQATRTTRVRPIELPNGATDAGKYLRQAVQAHPELYFARFVVLGEGDSEEVVIPRIAAARGVHIDQSFVAMVPLGGRHTNHFWKLLQQLEIPYATLLDLDFGRHGGGEGRIRDACSRLLAIGEDPFDGSDGVDGFASPADIDGLNMDQLKAWIRHLEEKWSIYFALPLDLDMVMLDQFRPAYTDHLEANQKGPNPGSDASNAVLGDVDTRPGGIAATFWTRPKRQDDLRWYRYLFLTQSKPSTHLRALAHVNEADLAAIKGPVSRLVAQVIDAVTPA